VMAGFLKHVLIPEDFDSRVINIHPSLLPRHGGLMDLDVHRSVLAAGDRESGCTLHLAEEQVDAGKIVLQKTCTVDPGETPETLKAKVQQLEGEAFIEFLRNPRKFIDLPLRQS